MESEQKILNRINDKLKKAEPIHITLPGQGLLKIEQPAPFLVVYRLPKKEKDYFSNTLGKTESSYIIAEDNALLQNIVHLIIKTLSDQYNRFLLLEIWMATNSNALPFTIHTSHKSTNDVSKKLCAELNKISNHNWLKTATISRDKRTPAPEETQPLISNESIEKGNVTFVGLEIAPFYINSETGEPYPLLLREMRRAFSAALRKSIFDFIRLQTSFKINSFQMLGTTTIDKTAIQIDRELAAYSKLFDFLMLVTPLNTNEAWMNFKKSGYVQNPVFHYRQMPVDPELIKRRLYNLPIEKITDPTIAFLYRDKRKEIDRMLNMLQEREKHDFMLSSIQVFGPVTDDLLEIAKALLVAIEYNGVTAEAERLSTVEFAEMARQELQWLKQQDARISDQVRIANDIEGILVSKGVLNISSNFSVSKKRAMPLLQHEVGTHVVTFYNGRAQPLELFSIGVPGYEELQEGLAVFAEYLTGGLTKSRMRTLAARVIAVDEMVSGKSFKDTFQLLTEKYHFKEKNAFNLCMRVYRGGGLTKDAVYLKGLLNIIEYIRQGKDLAQLLIGKIRQDYLPIVQELVHRRILKKPLVTPRFLFPEYSEKLEKVKNDGNIFKMIND